MLMLMPIKVKKTPIIQSGLIGLAVFSKEKRLS